ncbi:acyl carrier protein [Streptomyces sp. Act-28]
MTDHATPTSGTCRDDIKEIVAARLRIAVQDMDENTTLERLGLDSLLLAETVTAVEDRYRAPVDVLALTDRLTPTTPLSVVLDQLARAAHPSGN